MGDSLPGLLVSQLKKPEMTGWQPESPAGSPVEAKPLWEPARVDPQSIEQEAPMHRSE